MFRTRKRKVSPDKKSDKAKKLKVSSKIFRSPSGTKTNNEAKSKLSKLLPEGYDSIILTANTKPVESFEENEAVFGCVRLPILTKEDAMVWVKKFERKTFSSYRTQKTWKKDINTGLFKRKYICNVRNKDGAGQAGTATASCKGSIIFTIKDQEEIQANPDYYLRDYPSQVIIHFCHNHKIDPDRYMKNLRPSAELRIIFGTYFAKGHSPFSALICHKCDLHSSYGAEFYNVVSNGAICPSYNWCFHEYEKFFMRKFIEPSEDMLNEKLKDTVSQYNTKWRSECAIISYNPLFVLSICTPLMKSILRSGFAEELITVRCFSTPKTVPKRQKVILFLCHTPIGSLPFGVVVTFAEDTENVCEGIRALIKMFGVAAYSPKTIITDENALVSKALKKCFPQAQVLFNEFQMLQSIWRIIRVVCTDDDEEFQTLYNLFLVTLNSSSEEEFNKYFDSLLVYAEKYPKLTNFLKYFKLRSISYVLYARPKIEFNTDVLNYTDSGTILLQDVSIKYGNFFNIVQLFDFLSKCYVDHYERKLNKIVEGDLKGFFKTNFYVPLSKIADFTCEKISDTEFLVSLNEMKFFVNAELDTCTCQVGVHGGSCVHQYIVEKNLGLVPECYTPLCDDMLEIFKNILREKNTKLPMPDNDRETSEIGSTLDSLKTEVETFTTDSDEFSDMVSSVCCSDISNFSEMPQDMDHLGPLDEIFLVPPDITDSFTDITDEMMSPLALSEFDDNNEENEDFLDDSEQYNRESGELEPIQSSDSTQETNHYQTNVFVEVLPTNQSIPTTGVFSSQDSEGNVIIYEYTEDDIKCNNEVEVVEQCNTVEGESLVHLPTDGSIVLSTEVEGYSIADNVSPDVKPSVVYTYSSENQEFYEEVMTENDRKTAEIAEFLTNLPDTNNSSHHSLISTTRPNYPQGATIIHHFVDENNAIESQNINTTSYITDKDGQTVEQDHPTLSNGVVVVRNEEYFTNYKVLENNILSVVSEGETAFSNNVKKHISDQENYEVTSEDPAQNVITDSYEEQNLIMMSPNDLFDDNENIEPDMTTDTQDPKINVLSSVVIKPSAYTPNFPLNLNAIKHKTLRNVKEDSRIRMNEQRITQSGNVLYVNDSRKLEPRKMILPVVIRKELNKQLNLTEGENKTYEKDVIKLYCNQSGEKILPEDDKQGETKSFEEEILSNVKPLENAPEENREAEFTLLQLPEEHKLTQIVNDSQEVGLQESEKEISNSEEMTLVESDTKGDLQEFDEDIQNSETSSLKSEKGELDPEEFILSDCNPEELAKNEFVEIIEIDSDGLEELASQKFDTNLTPPAAPTKSIVSQELFSKKNSLKITPVKDVPSRMLPFKAFSIKNVPSNSNVMPLRDFMLKTASPQHKMSSKSKELEKASIDCNKSELLQKQLTSTFSQLENLLGRNNFKESVEKFLGKRDTVVGSSDHSPRQAERQSPETMTKIKNLGSSVTLEPINKRPLNPFVKKTYTNIDEEAKLLDNETASNFDKNIGCDGKHTIRFSDTNQLKEKIRGRLFTTTKGNIRYLDNTRNIGNEDKIVIKNVKENSELNVKDDTGIGIKKSNQIKETKKGKVFMPALKTYETKKQKIIVKDDMTTDKSDNNEANLSDFEDYSDSFESLSSEMDDVSENERYELQYLSTSSDESINDSGSNPQSDDYSSDELINNHGLSGTTNKTNVQRRKLRSDLPPGLRHAQINKRTNQLSRNVESDSSFDDLICQAGVSDSRNKKRFKKLKKISPTVQSDDESCDESSGDVRISGLTYKNNAFSNLHSGKKSMGNRQKANKSNVKSEKIITQNCHSDDDNRVDVYDIRYKGKGKFLPKHISDIKSLSKSQIHPYPTFDVKSLDQKTKKQVTVTNNKVKDVETLRKIPAQNVQEHTASIEHDNGTKSSSAIICQNPDLKSKNTDETRKSQKFDPKMLNIKSNIKSSTKVKLASLPSVLSQSYNQRIARGHKMFGDKNIPNILPDTQDTDIAIKRKTSENVSQTATIVQTCDKIQNFEKVKSDNLICSLPSNNSINESSASERVSEVPTGRKTYSQNDSSKKVSQTATVVATCDKIQNLNKVKQEKLASPVLVNKPTLESNASKKACKVPTVRKTYNKSDISKNVSRTVTTVKTCDKVQNLKKLKPENLTCDSSTVESDASKNVSQAATIVQPCDKIQNLEKVKPEKLTCRPPGGNSTDENKASKAPTVRKTSKKVKKSEDIKPTESVVTLERVPGYQTQIDKAEKDIKDLEAILTSEQDFDRDSDSDINKRSETVDSATSILQNTDLSFLFDDPRFETVVEKETSPSAVWVSAPSSDASQVKTSNINQLCMHKKYTSRKKESGTSRSLKVEGKKKTKNIKAKNITKQSDKINSQLILPLFTGSNSYPPTGLVQTGQNNIITLLVYTTLPNNSLRNILPKPEVRNILPKPEVNPLENNSKALNLIHTKISDTSELVTNNENVKKGDTSLNQTRRNDVTEPSGKIVEYGTNKISEIFTPRSDREGKILRQVVSTSDNKPKAKEIKKEANREKSVGYKTRRSSSRKEILPTKLINTLDVTAKSDKVKDDEIAGVISPNIENPNSSSTESRVTRSKSIQREVSFTKERTKRNANLVQKTTTKKSKEPSQYKVSADIDFVPVDKCHSLKLSPIKKHTSVTRYAAKTINNSKDEHKEGRFKSRRTDDYIKEIANEKGSKQRGNKKIILQEASDISIPKPLKVSKLSPKSTLDLSTSELALNYNSDDFENSIVASVLDKQSTLKNNLKYVGTKKEGPIISSTPIKSIGYEDAFKMFLETSSRWSPNTQYERSSSDIEMDIDGSDWRSNRETRRRSKSVSNRIEQQFDSKKLEHGKMKKSVSWADGLNVIEYLQESDKDSDDSEIKDTSKNSEFVRGKRKKSTSQERSRSSSPKRRTSRQEDQTIVASYKTDAVKCRAQNTKTKSRFASSVGEFTYLETNTRRRSLVRTKESITLDKRRSRSSTPKRESVRTINRKRSRSYVRGENFEPKLVVLLERNKNIDRMCQKLKTQTSEICRGRRRERVGYKELLYRATLSKMF